MEIARYKAAITRTGFSKPVQSILALELLRPEFSLFDYGCGKGDDLRLLSESGFTATGWDPHFSPAAPKQSADIVNLGFVLNVIEDPRERLLALQDAWGLAGRALVVAVQPDIGVYGGNAFNDGIVTSRKTFQKYYSQDEIKDYVSRALEMEPYSIAPGVVVVFRDEEMRFAFMQRRVRSTIRRESWIDLYGEQLAESDKVAALIRFIEERGRYPILGEFPDLDALYGEFTSTSKLRTYALQKADIEKMATSTAQIREELLLFLSLARLERTGRPKPSQITGPLREDVKMAFSNYRVACQESDSLLLSIGKPEVVSKAINSASVGKRLPQAIYIHKSAEHTLPLPLRLLKACAETIVGQIDGYNILKIGRGGTRVSFLFYPTFESEDHPGLQLAVKVDLPIQRYKVRKYDNPRTQPILHRKEEFVTLDFPSREEWAQVTQLEEAMGLLGRSDIGTRASWERVKGSLL